MASGSVFAVPVAHLTASALAERWIVGGERLLGEAEFVAAGLDGKAEGALRRDDRWHRASLARRPRWLDDSLGRP